MLSVGKLDAIKQSVAMLSVIMLSVVMLSVVMLRVVMRRYFVAPIEEVYTFLRPVS